MVEQADRTVPELLTDTTRTLERLFRAEVRLARAGAVEQVSSIVPGGSLALVGAWLVVLTTALLTLSAVARLSLSMPLWQAALVVAACLGVIATVVVGSALRVLRAPSTKIGTHDALGD